MWWSAAKFGWSAIHLGSTEGRMRIEDVSEPKPEFGSNVVNTTIRWQKCTTLLPRNLWKGAVWTTTCFLITLSTCWRMSKVEGKYCHDSSHGDTGVNTNFSVRNGIIFFVQSSTIPQLLIADTIRVGISLCTNRASVGIKLYLPLLEVVLTGVGIKLYRQTPLYRPIVRHDSWVWVIPTNGSMQ